MRSGTGLLGFFTAHDLSLLLSKMSASHGSYLPLRFDGYKA